jgi:hypothetical protein
MARKKKEEEHRHPGASEPNAELLPPRKALTLLSTDPAAYTGLLGDPTAADAAPAPATGAAGTATSAADSADDLADAQAAGSGEQTVSDQPQTITRDDTQTASSET